MNLKECLKNNDMILPNYDDISIIDVVRCIYNYCGYSYDENFINKDVLKYIKNKKHILLILSDGMGSNLINSLSDTMLLKKNKVADINTVFPTTTGTVLTSVATGEYPTKHGMIGWYNYYRKKDISYYTLVFSDRKSGKNLKELGISSEDIYTCDSVMNKLKRKTIALFPEGIVDSDFSKFTLNKNRISFSNIKEAFKEAIDYIKDNLDDETFTYMYLSDIDSLSHDNGVYSESVLKKMDEIEEELIKLKKENIPDLEVIVIADHGQIDVDNEIIIDFYKYNKYFYALPAIDFGTATYYVKSDKENEFLKEFEKDYKDRMFIFKTEEFLNNNVFGKDKVSEYLKSNLGEYISFCKKGSYFVNTDGDINNYVGKIKGSHSGFSKEELTIPLIVIDI